MTAKSRFTVCSIALFLLFPLSKKGQTHILAFECPVYECDITGEHVKANFITAPAGSKLDSIRFNSDNDIIITFRKWKVPLDIKDTSFVMQQLAKIEAFNYDLNSATRAGKIQEAAANIKQKIPEKYFIIKNQDFKSLVQSLTKRSWDISAGALTIPFKVRDKPFDFSKDITLAGTAAFGYRFTKNFTLFATGSLGISSIALDSINTRGKTVKPTNLSAFTLSPGLVFAWQKLQISVNYGWDHLSHADADKGWIYDTHGWWGLGIGYQLFSPGGSGSKKTSTGEKQN